MPELILSLDVGGTYIKAAIYNFNGRCIAICKRRNRIVSAIPQEIEYNPEELWSNCCKCISAILSENRIDAQSIAAIGLSAQGSGCFFIGKNDKKIRNFISSGDARAQSIVERWKADGTMEKLFPHLLFSPSAGCTSPQLAWLKEHERENYDQIDFVLSMKDYLVYRFTGNVVNGIGCASRSGLMNMDSLEFDVEAAALQGISEKSFAHGKLLWDIEPAGVLSGEAATCCGLLPGTPVSAGSHDVVATALGMGCVDRGSCFVTMGTCAVNGYISDQPVRDGSIKYNERFAYPGRYLLEQPGSVSSGVLEWVIDVLFDRSSIGAQEIYSEVNSLVEESSLNNFGPVFVPFIRGSRADPFARGSWMGLDSRHTRADMLRAVYEAVVFIHCECLNILFSGSSTPEKVQVSGGAANSAVWMQMLADVLGSPVEIVPNEEISAKGAAVCAAIAAGIYPDTTDAIAAMVSPGKIIMPRLEYNGIYKEKHERFRHACDISAKFR